MNDGSDLHRLVVGCPPGSLISLPEREYHIYGQACPKFTLCPSNNRNGSKPVAFPMQQLQGVTLDGNGSRFLLHGEVMPFWLSHCRDLTLKNFSIDWVRPFYSQGIIAHVDEEGLELQIDPVVYPHHSDGDRVIFDGEDWSHALTEGIFEIDAVRGTPAYLSGDNLGTRLVAADLKMRILSSGRIRIDHRFQRIATVGNGLVFRHFRRHYPGVFMEHCENVRMENVTLHHAAGTGVIAQFCDTIALERMVVGPAPDSGRLFSVTVDAAHFVNCRGLIHEMQCRFSHMLDDPTNVHGIYSRIHAREDRHTMIVEMVHHEQHGVPVGGVGDRVRLCDCASLLPLGEWTLASVEICDSRLRRVRTREPLPEALPQGSVMENLTWTPDVHIEHCIAGPNRARGYLITTPGKVLIENNRIAAAGAGIKISGDANYWFESGAVQDVTIRNNIFSDCCYGPTEWGTAMIDIDPEIPNPWASAEHYHRNIRITGNTFETFHPGVLYARSVDGIEFSDNRIERTDTYPAVDRLPGLLNFDACRNIDAHSNIVDARFSKPLQVINDQPPGCPRVQPQSSLDKGTDQRSVT